MPFSIDVRNKAKADGGLYPERYGYQLRGTFPTSIVVHTTEGPRGQSLTKAANHLYHSADVSAHFLVGTQGEIIQFLDPRRWQAWHAGESRAGYTNSVSIGIEILHTSGDAYPAIQIDALAWLLRRLMADHGIPPTKIDTHGQIAVPGPYSRKQDPTNWPREAFKDWVAALVPAQPADPWQAWGPIGRPTPEQQGWAVPRAWLLNQRLGACVAPERYSESGEYSVAEFTAGLIVYYKRRNAAEVYLF